MLYISKWKAAAILLTALICCLFAVPNFFPEDMVKRWPAWAHARVVMMDVWFGRKKHIRYMTTITKPT